MTVKLTTRAFTAGEISPRFYARTDLSKYDTGVAEALNMIVDYRGGLSKVPGTRFCNFFQGRTVSVPFRTNVENTSNFQVIFGEGYIRFTQDGEYLRETTAAYTAGSDTEITVSGHSLIAGDLLALNPSTPEAVVVEVTDVTGDVIEFALLNGANLFDAVSLTGDCAKILTLTSPYTTDQLAALQCSQHLSTIKVCSPDHPPHSLRFDGTDWTFMPTQFGTAVPRPGAPDLVVQMESGQSEAKDESSVAVCITAVNSAGEESLPSPITQLNNSFNIATDRGSMLISWAPVAGAVRYNVYRTLFSTATSLSKLQQFGFIGSTRGVTFTDSNVVPDFTQAPPRGFNPFANGAITQIEVSNFGEDYSTDTQIAVAGGTGFVGVVDVTAQESSSSAPLYDGGEVVGVNVLSGGSGYTLSSTVSLTQVGSGTGAVLAVSEVTPLTGNNPRVSAVFQQRRWYAGTRNAPMSVWASRPGTFQNFDFSEVANEGDSIAFALDASELTPIMHLLPIRDSLLMFHTNGVDRLKAESGRAITNETAMVENQAQIGIGTAAPILVGGDVVYAQRHGTSIQNLSYTFYTNSFTPIDLSVLSSHLFGGGRNIRKLVWAEEPLRIVWALRSDGVLLACTFQKEQEVVAWTTRATQGKFVDIVELEEVEGPALYVTVEREINGQICYVQEKFIYTTPEVAVESWFLDCALEYENGTEVTTISGLGHLEGMTVKVLADGDVEPDKVVTNGQIELEQPRAQALVGLGYKARVRTLPLTDPEERLVAEKKRAISLAARLAASRGLFVGLYGSKLYEVKEPVPEYWDQARELQSGIVTANIPGKWARDVQVVIEQNDPLPLTVLGLVQEIQV